MLKFQMETQESTIYRLAMRSGGQGINVQISNFWAFLEQGMATHSSMKDPDLLIETPKGTAKGFLNHLIQIFSSIIILNKSPRGTRLTLLYMIAQEQRSWLKSDK